MTDTFEYTDGKAGFDSDTISALFFNENTNDLVVVFKDTGRKWLYPDRDKDEWDDFVKAESKGRFYNYYIKGDENATRLPNDTNFVRINAGAPSNGLTVVSNGNIGSITGGFTATTVVSALTNKYSIRAELATVNTVPANVSFDVEAANDVEAVKAFHDYVSRLNATGKWTVKAVTRHF